MKNMDLSIDLRDYFAASANEQDVQRHKDEIQDVLLPCIYKDTGATINIRQKPANWRELAKYKYADAMMKAREL